MCSASRDGFGADAAQRGVSRRHASSRPCARAPQRRGCPSPMRASHQLGRSRTKAKVRTIDRSFFPRMQSSGGMGMPRALRSGSHFTCSSCGSTSSDGRLPRSFAFSCSSARTRAFGGRFALFVVDVGARAIDTINFPPSNGRFSRLRAGSFGGCRLNQEVSHVTQREV